MCIRDRHMLEAALRVAAYGAGQAVTAWVAPARCICECGLADRGLLKLLQSQLDRLSLIHISEPTRLDVI
eukprot:10500291-Prorocentrum_lima.AAC.1